MSLHTSLLSGASNYKRARVDSGMKKMDEEEGEERITVGDNASETVQMRKAGAAEEVQSSNMTWIMLH